VRCEQRLNPAKQSCLAERPGDYGGDDFRGVRNLQSRQGIGGAIEDAHLRRTFSQVRSQIRSGHPGGMQLGDQEIYRACTRLRQLQCLLGICRREDEEFSVLENLLNALTKRFQVFHDKNDRMSSRL